MPRRCYPPDVMARFLRALGTLAVAGPAAIAFAGGSTASAPAPPPSPSPSPTSTPPSGWSVDPNPFAFSLACVGSSASKTFTLTNFAERQLEVEQLTIDPVPPFSLDDSEFDRLLESGESTTFDVLFSPQDASAVSGAVTLVTNRGDQTVQLSGSSRDASISVAPSSLSYGAWRIGEASSVRRITVVNPGGGTLKVKATPLYGATPGDFVVSGGGAFSLAGGATRTVSVSFKPGGTGTRSAALAFESDACSPARVPVVRLGGIGAVPGIGVEPAALALAGLRAKETPPGTVTVQSVGDVPLEVTAVSLFGERASEFSLAGVPRLPMTLGAGVSFTLSVRARIPYDGRPMPEAELRISSDDRDRPLVAVKLTSSLATPSPSPSPRPSPTPEVPGEPAPPPSRAAGPGFGVSDYLSEIFVAAGSGGLIGALVLFRNARLRRVARRWSA